MYSPGVFGAVKPRRSVSPSLTQPGRVEDGRQVGNEGLCLRVGGHRHRASSRANRLEGSRLAHDQVMRHRVGIEQHDLHRLARFHDKPLQIEAELLGNRLDAHHLHAKGAQVTPDGPLRVVWAASRPASRRTGWRLTHQDQSADLPVWPPRWRRWRAPAVRLTRQARHCRGCAGARRSLRRGRQASASGFTSFARRSKVAASRRIQPSASRAAVRVARSLVCREELGDWREELIAQGCPLPKLALPEDSAR